MSYTIEEIKGITGANGQIVSSGSLITYLLTDSRHIIFPSESLFIAIKGPHQDGHQYIHQAFDAGVRNFIIEEKKVSFPEAANYLIVENSVDALQNIAAFHRAKFAIDIIGITGSNGKTIVKEWIYHLLRSVKNICRNPKSYNSQTGVPLSVWQLDEHNDLGIFEAGISLPGEMQRLEKIIRPTRGIFTNIGTAHAQGFSSIEEKINEKLQLFAGDAMRKLFYCCDYPEIDLAVKTTFSSDMLLSWSRHDNIAADVQVKNIDVRELKTYFDLQFKQKELLHLEIPFPDAASLENAVHAILIADHLGLDINILQEELKTLPPVSMRLELKKGINGCRIINDVYSADINSLEIALQFLNTRKQNLQTHVILSDIEQSGMAPAVLYRKVADLIAENKIQRFTGIGKNISEFASYFTGGKMNAQFYPSTNAFLQTFDENDYQHEFILLKGARSFSLERISNELSEKTHGTILQVDLNHLIHNLQVYRRLLHPGVKTMAMVKAFSYGSGTAEIAAALVFNHIDYLAVAYTDEGVELRKNGIHLPIMVMNPEPDTFEQIVEHDLEPEIYNFRILKLFSDFIAGTEKEIRIHIKIDTGMHRLGFNADDMEALTKEIKKNPHIKVASIFSHLAAADDRKEKLFTQKQIADFDKVSANFNTQFSYPIFRHILNSSGISSYPEAQFDMVRLGIGLYGFDPSEQIAEKLLPVSYLFTTVSQIKNIKAGESIGYGRSTIAEHDMRIATLNIGYADGFSRRLSNGKGRVSIRNAFAAVTGKVCMDMIMVDITEIANVQEGDTAEIFGAQISLEEYAEMMDTIPYEALTGISQRVKRVYIQE